MCVCGFNESLALQGWGVVLFLFTLNSNLHYLEDLWGDFQIQRVQYSGDSQISQSEGT